MIEPKRRDMVGLFPLPGNVVHHAGGRYAPHRKPLRLTISVEKIDILLADIQKHVEDLQRQMTNLRLVRTQLAVYQQKTGAMQDRPRTVIAPSSVCSSIHDCVLVSLVARVAESQKETDLGRVTALMDLFRGEGIRG
jgi:hypothetical protein